MASYGTPGERRIIGRILSLGFPLPGVRVDNYNFLSAPSFFDYDALVVDPADLSQLIDGVADGSVEVKTFGGAPVRNVPALPDDVALAGVLLRRRDEVAHLLDHGGVVVFFAHPPQVHRGIDSIDQIDDLYWLGEHAPELVAADGNQAEICDYQHAMAPFVLGQLANLQYRAQLRDRTDAFVRSYGGAAIGATIAGSDGRIVMLPALKSIPGGEGRYAMSDSLQTGIRRMLGVIAEGRPPQWIAQYPLPGVDGRAEKLAEARAREDDAQGAVSDAERELDEIEKYQRLLWQHGQVGLEDVVIDALRLIGCDTYTNDPAALELRVDGTRVLLEIDASDADVDMAPHYRLRQRIERAIARGGAAPRGAIIINGYRLDPPAERKQQASDTLRVAAETMRYSVVPTTLLFDAVAAKLAGDESAASSFRRMLLEGAGLLESPTSTAQER
jgi:hypothetical protein